MSPISVVPAPDKVVIPTKSTVADADWSADDISTTDYQTVLVEELEAAFGAYVGELMQHCHPLCTTVSHILARHFRSCCEEPRRTGFGSVG